MPLAGGDGLCYGSGITEIVRKQAKVIVLTFVQFLVYYIEYTKRLAAMNERSRRYRLKREESSQAERLS